VQSWSSVSHFFQFIPIYGTGLHDGQMKGRVLIFEGELVLNISKHLGKLKSTSNAKQSSNSAVT
jgi:hypothetical protein